ncbi:MAG: outer spore coat protein CotE [Clostridium sp.]|nr:MAG: outer spore coat protein CotE [Clostridium sp.]
MNEIREIVTKAVVAKGKKLFNMHEHIESSTHPYSIFRLLDN